MKNKKTAISSLVLMSLLISTSGSAFAVGQSGGNGQKGGASSNIERPDDWMDLTPEERQTFMQNQGIEGGSNGSRNENRPDGVEDMTEAEKEAYRATNQGQNVSENKPEQASQNAASQGKKTFNQNAQKAKNYQGFTGELKAKKNFSDKDEIHNLEAVEFLQQRGILDGYSDGSFKPQDSINRAESIKVLLESLGEEPSQNTQALFSDVPTDAWFTGYVNKAKEKGIVDGYEDGTFQPGKTVNQVELLKVAFESFGIDLSNYPVTSLPNGADTSAWYAPYLQYAVDNNLLDSTNVNPGEGMTREAFSEVVYRLIQQQENL